MRAGSPRAIPGGARRIVRTLKHSQEGIVSNPVSIETANGGAITGFSEYLRVRGLAPLTIEAYESDLAQLSKFLCGQPLIGARREDLSGYIGHLLSKMTARSAARKVTCFRTFFKFLLMDGLIAVNPMLRVESPKGWK